MYRWLAESLGNVSVKRKLGIGFGLVLLLTLLITFTGWTGMSGIISRGDKLGFISSLNELTKDLRLARLDYEARRGEQGPGAVNELLAKLASGLQTARGLADLGPAGLAPPRSPKACDLRPSARKLGQIQHRVGIDRRPRRPVSRLRGRGTRASRQHRQSRASGNDPQHLHGGSIDRVGIDRVASTR